MSWQIETTRKFDKEFKKLDRYTQKLIYGWITKNINATTDLASLANLSPVIFLGYGDIVSVTIASFANSRMKISLF